jgi:PAS domain S-box-containing protein
LGQDTSKKTKKELIAELEQAKTRIKELEADIPVSATAIPKEQFVIKNLKTFVENSPDLVFVKDTQGRFLRVNQSWLQYWCASADFDSRKVLGKTDFDFMPACIAENTRKEEQEIIETGQALIGKQLCCINDKTGKENCWSVTKMPLYNALGKIVGIYGICRDLRLCNRLRNACRKISSSCRQF